MSQIPVPPLPVDPFPGDSPESAESPTSPATPEPDVYEPVVIDVPPSDEGPQV